MAPRSGAIAPSRLRTLNTHAHFEPNANNEQFTIQWPFGECAHWFNRCANALDGHRVLRWKFGHFVFDWKLRKVLFWVSRLGFDVDDSKKRSPSAAIVKISIDIDAEATLTLFYVHCRALLRNGIRNTENNNRCVERASLAPSNDRNQFSVPNETRRERERKRTHTKMDFPLNSQIQIYLCRARDTQISYTELTHSGCRMFMV